MSEHRGSPVVYPWVTHKNLCPMNLYFLIGRNMPDATIYPSHKV